jgi:hypothetical protein
MKAELGQGSTPAPQALEAGEEAPAKQEGQA